MSTGHSRADSVIDASIPTRATAQPRGRPMLWIVVLLGLMIPGWYGWQLWQTRLTHEHDRADASAQQWQALDARIVALGTDQRAQAQRLQQADATNRVLRGELLGVGQRAALLEDSVRKLADPERHGAQALRLDETELLLGQGEQRLRLDGDLDGARSAYALAAGVLAGVDDPAYISLRQALVQERAALDALGADPKALAAGRLDAFTATLSMPAPALSASNAALPWWQRAFAHVIDVRPSNRMIAADGADRAAAFAALQLELALARAAIERRDDSAYKAALLRANDWMAHLWPDSPDLRHRRAQLQALRAMSLTLALPTLGSTRQQLQSMRTTH